MSYDHYLPILAYVTNPADAMPMPEAEIARFAGLVPDGLADVWRRHGNRLSFADGRVQLCDPVAMQARLAPWFSGDPEFDIARMVPYAYSSSGDILLTNGTLETFSIALPASEFKTGRYNPPPAGAPEIDFYLAHSLNVYLDAAFIEMMGFDLHAESAAELGALAPGEIFTYSPPLQQMAEGSTLVKAPILETIENIQASGPLELHRTFNDELEAARYQGQTFVRTIGRP